MNTHVIALLFLAFLVLGAVAVVVATGREVRRDRRPTPAAWPDWREENLWRNLRIG